MSWKSKVAGFVKQVGPACKFVAKIVLNTVIPGSKEVIELVERALDCATESADKIWEVEKDKVAKADLERVGTLLAEMQEKFGTILEQMAALKGLPDAARQILDTALATNARVREAGQQLQTLAAARRRAVHAAVKPIPAPDHSGPKKGRSSILRIAKFVISNCVPFSLLGARPFGAIP